MPNWPQIVSEQLKATGIALNDSIIAELAAHLEEVYETNRSLGLTDAEAHEQTMREVKDWCSVALQIRHTISKEDLMNHRTKTLWLPALATLLGASLSLMICQLLGMRPHLVWVIGVGMSFYWPWLATLPVFGAVGAYLSQRAQGPTPARLAAALSPALVMLIVMLLVLPFGLAMDGVQFLRLVSFGIGLINWVVIPAVALLVGTLPFLDKRERQPQHIATVS